jgi:hypothetical protein
MLNYRVEPKLLDIGGCLIESAERLLGGREKSLPRGIFVAKKGINDA